MKGIANEEHMIKRQIRWTNTIIIGLIMVILFVSLLFVCIYLEYGQKV